MKPHRPSDRARAEGDDIEDPKGRLLGFAVLDEEQFALSLEIVDA